jgi:hypothetical protein
VFEEGKFPGLAFSLLLPGLLAVGATVAVDAVGVVACWFFVCCSVVSFDPPEGVLDALVLTTLPPLLTAPLSWQYPLKEIKKTEK